VIDARKKPQKNSMETSILVPQIPPSLVRGGRKLPFHSTDVARHVALYGQNADAPHIFGGILSTAESK
jgi:hypothetical protein